MNYALILVSILILVIGGVGGYCLGRFQSSLVNEIRTLREGKAREVQKPTVVLGSYEPPREVSTAPDTTKRAGLAEVKTPERIDFEVAQAIDKEALGR